MAPDDSEALDPRVLGRRLLEARRARNLTQEAAAGELNLKRPTLVAIEKGDRRVSAVELVAFARLYGCGVSDLVGRHSVSEPLIAQFRTTLRDVAETNASALEGLQDATRQLQEDAERYVELERLLQLELARKYPPPCPVDGLVPERAGEEVASAERHRLGLGDGPVAHLRHRLEADVGLRTFFFDMASDVAGVFAYNDTFGGCIGVNSRHPFPRQRWTLAHEYGHFLTSRFAVEVTWLSDRRRTSPRERVADSFAQHFLMPSAGLNRRFSDIVRARDGAVTLADICSLADLYEVSIQALVRRLEALNRVPRGLWDRLDRQGFRPAQAQEVLGLTAQTKSEPRFPRRYEMLAVQAYASGELTEGQLAKYLELDRVATRQRASEIQQRLSSERGDELGSLEIDLREPVHGK